jgi:DNA-binding MarR family transcriptional regulator
MTAALDRLEASGYIRRVRDEHDRRRVLIELTDRAQNVGGFYAGHAAIASELYDNYTTDELLMLLRFVRRGREFNEERAAEVEADNAARPSLAGGGRGARRRRGPRTS